MDIIDMIWYSPRPETLLKFYKDWGGGVKRLRRIFHNEDFSRLKLLTTYTGRSRHCNMIQTVLILTHVHERTHARTHTHARTTARGMKRGSGRPGPSLLDIKTLLATSLLGLRESNYKSLSSNPTFQLVLPLCHRCLFTYGDSSSSSFLPCPSLSPLPLPAPRWQFFC